MHKPEPATLRLAPDGMVVALGLLRGLGWQVLAAVAVMPDLGANQVRRVLHAAPGPSRFTGGRLLWLCVVSYWAYSITILPSTAVGGSALGRPQWP